MTTNQSWDQQKKGSAEPNSNDQPRKSWANKWSLLLSLCISRWFVMQEEMTESWCVCMRFCVCVCVCTHVCACISLCMHLSGLLPLIHTSIACIRKAKQKITNLSNSNKILPLWCRLQHSFSNSGSLNNSIYFYNRTHL